MMQKNDADFDQLTGIAALEDVYWRLYSCKKALDRIAAERGHADLEQASALTDSAMQRLYPHVDLCPL